MKKNYILIVACLILCISKLNAQCPVTITASDTVICEGNNVTLTGSGATTYSWSVGATMSSITVAPLNTTVYTLTGTNGGCTSSATVTITVNPNPTVTATSSGAICPGGTATLTASGAFAYVWTPNTGLNSSTLPVVLDVAPSTYSVTGTDTNGCSSNGYVTVYVNPNPTVTISSPSNICVGNTANLIAGGSSTPVIASYTWSTGGLIVGTSASIIVNPISTTVYSLAVTDVNGCTGNAATTLYVNQPPTITVSSPNVICAGSGGIDTLRASGANTYTWAPGAYLSNTTGSTTICTPTTQITYTVSGSYAGCTSTTTVTVLVSSPMTLSVSTTPSACYPCNGSASLTGITGGSPPYVYNWLPMGINTMSVNNLCTGVYSVTVTDQNGCIAMDTTTIGTTASPTLTLTESSASICEGDSATLTATGAVNYFWYPYNSLNDSLVSTVIAKPTVTTTYTITGYDANSCSTMAYLTLSVTPTPTVGFVMQRDTTTTGVWFAYPSYSSSVTNATWYWGDGTSSIGLSPSHTYTAAAHYNICVTAFNSCGDSANSCQNDSLYRLNQNIISVTVINNSTTGITQVNMSNKQIAVYPNPTTGNFTIETNATFKQTLQIVDVNGRLVLTQTINGKTNIDASSLNEGVYNISVLGNDGVINKRLVIVK